MSSDAIVPGMGVVIGTRDGKRNGWVLSITPSGLLAIQVMDEILYRKPHNVTRMT